MRSYSTHTVLPLFLFEFVFIVFLLFENKSIFSCFTNNFFRFHIILYMIKYKNILQKHEVHVGDIDHFTIYVQAERGISYIVYAIIFLWQKIETFFFKSIWLRVVKSFVWHQNKLKWMICIFWNIFNKMFAHLCIIQNGMILNVSSVTYFLIIYSR